MATNKQIRQDLERIYGRKCMLHEGFKIQRPKPHRKRRFKGKRIADQLTLHHIIPRSKGGATSIENGAILCRSCHEFLEQQNEKTKAELNQLLINYKECKVVFVDELKLPFKVNSGIVEVEEPKEKYNRAKFKSETREKAKEYLDR